jgi:DNA polymerase-3 subunit beta
MQFTIEKEVLLRGLARIQGIVEKKTTLPVLSNVLLEASDGEICLTATDLEVGMRSIYPAQIQSEGRTTVSAKKFYEIVKELPGGEVSFRSRDNSWVEIRSGKALFNIVGLPADEFPHFPKLNKNDLLPMDGEELCEMIEKTFFSVSTDESKYNLGGIFMKAVDEAGRKLLRMVATDGHRLALVQRPISVDPGAELTRGVILPRKGIIELRKIAEESTGTIFVGFLENNVVIQRDATTVVMRLVDGEFPDYNRVIPKQQGFQATIRCDIFLHALRRMVIVSSDKTRGVKLILKPGVLEISSSNPELGEAQEEIEVEYDGPEISLGFNARYLIDILNAQNESAIFLQLRDNLSPGVLQPVKDADTLAVVMPMRL